MLTTHDARLRDEIAAVAARLIAEDGLDYAGAKARALREVAGGSSRRRLDCMPDNARIEAAVREHQALFMADSQPARLAHLRRVACDAMRFLAAAGDGIEPFAVGAIVNGTAGEHSDVHLQIVDDNAKDIEIFLVNAGIDFDAADAGDGRGGETLTFLWPPRAARAPGATEASETVHLTICERRQRRTGASIERANLAALERLVEASAP